MSALFYIFAAENEAEMILSRSEVSNLLTF